MIILFIISINDPHVSQEEEDSLLIKAARIGKQDIVEEFLRLGADIESRNKVYISKDAGYFFK